MKRKLTCTNYFIKLEKKIFKRAHQIKMLIFGLAQTSHFGLLDIITPESQLAFHIYYVKYEATLTCKTINLDSEGNDVLKTFSISYMYNTKMTI